MDEIGFMELKAPHFCKAVQEHLDGDTPVLAAVKAQYDIPYINRLRTHPKAQFLGVAAENRNELFEILVPFVSEWNR